MVPQRPEGTTKATPYYEQVANILRARITGSDTDQPIRLPTERELCRLHQVSRITISKALDILEQEGLVQRAPSRGTITVPEAIRRWKRLRQDRAIHVLTGREDLVAILSSYYGQIYQGLCSRAEQAGYRLTTHHLYSTRTSLAHNPILPEPDSCLGVIFVGFMNEPTIRVYTQAGYSVVCLDYWTTNPLADGIVVDCYTEGQHAVDFLLRHGHRNLFYMGNTLTYGPPPEKESDAMQLLAGIQRGLDMAGQPMLPPERFRFIGNQNQDAPCAAEWYLSLRPRPTAGVIFNVGLARLLIDHLRQRGVRCPEDVSIITKTWDGAPTSMTSLCSPARLMGQLAVDALLDRAASRRTSGVRIAAPSRLDRGRTVRQIELPG